MIFPYENAKKKLPLGEPADEPLAEAVRFELTNGSHRRQFSRLLPSTTRPRFQKSVIIHKRNWLDQETLRPLPSQANERLAERLTATTGPVVTQTHAMRVAGELQ